MVYYSPVSNFTTITFIPLIQTFKCTICIPSTLFNLHEERKKKKKKKKREPQKKSKEKKHGETKGNSSSNSSSSDALARERSTSSNWGGMLSFGCPLSISLLPRLTVSPSYDDGAYTSGYLYLIFVEAALPYCRRHEACSRKWSPLGW